MLKIIIDDKVGLPMISATGSLIEILGDLSIAVAGIYQTLGKSSPDAAEAFKRTFQKIVATEDLIWKEEIPGIMMGFSRPMRPEER